MKTLHILMLVASGVLMAAVDTRAGEQSADILTERSPWVLPGMFSEHMILQREKPIRVWGWGPAGETVTVRMIASPDSGHAYNEEALAEVAGDGSWSVTLPPAPAGGPYSFLVQPKDDTLAEAFSILFSQVLVGDVWLIVGQSNVLWPLDETTEGADAIAQRHQYPNMRILELGHRRPHEVKGPLRLPVSFWGNPRWESAAYLAPRSSRRDIPGGPSAVGYYFSTALYDHFNGEVPIGLIYIGAIIAAQTWVDDAEVERTPGLAAVRGKGFPDATSRSFDANIAPLAGFGLRGFIYYQGESNSMRGQDEIYRHALPALMRSWRRAWGGEALPFMVVQLPAALDVEVDSSELHSMSEALLRSWQEASRGQEAPIAHVRDGQRAAVQREPNAGLVVTLDIGGPEDWRDVHPRAKKPIGDRLALLARLQAYGEENPRLASPLPAETIFSGDTVTVRFQYANDGLDGRGDDVVGFELAGSDGVFHVADATVEGATVRVQSKSVAAPMVIRYAWGAFPAYSLFNKGGLPASPFQIEKSE